MRVANDILIPELERLLAQGKEVRFTPSGNSMRPFIEGDCDSVILAPLTREPRRGDVVLAQLANNTYVLHRIIRIAYPAIILQGDGNLSGEEQCTAEHIIGRVIAIEKPNGHRKPLTRGQLWYALRPIRRYLLKIYRHTLLKMYQ